MSALSTSTPSEQMSDSMSIEYLSPSPNCRFSFDHDVVFLRFFFLVAACALALTHINLCVPCVFELNLLCNKFSRQKKNFYVTNSHIQKKNQTKWKGDGMKRERRRQCGTQEEREKDSSNDFLPKPISQPIFRGRAFRLDQYFIFMIVF